MLACAADTAVRARQQAGSEDFVANRCTAPRSDARGGSAPSGKIAGGLLERAHARQCHQRIDLIGKFYTA